MQGMIHVYTGEGKGKTTAALGLAARALGYGKRVVLVQFLKGGGAPSGEVLPAGMPRSGLEVLRFDQVHPLFDPSVDPEALAKRVRIDFARAETRLMRGDVDLGILDEINNCLAQGLLPIESLLAFLEARPQGLEVVLTGRGAPAALLEKADYVTEMRMVKHPARSRGAPARKGIEY